MKMTKEAKEFIRGEYAKAWDSNPRMVDHCVKSCSGFIDFGDVIVTCNKPGIQKHFWFGEHNYEDRSDECKAASESVDYFMRENMGNCYAFNALQRMGCADSETDYYYTRFHNPVLVYGAYCGQPEDCRLGYIDWQDDMGEFHCREPKSRFRQLTDSETDELREFFRGEVEKFEKRLHTYLKRYGLSKCEYDTFWADR